MMAPFKGEPTGIIQDDAAQGWTWRDLLNTPVFRLPPQVPNLEGLRGTALFWGSDETVLIYRRQKGKKAMPTIDMAYVARWPLMRTEMHTAASHAQWEVALREFVNMYNHILDLDETAGGYVFPANITCVIHSNLVCCYGHDGALIGWTPQAKEDFQRLAELMCYFRAPVYVCSAESRRWNLPDSFDRMVEEVHRMCAQFPNIMVCKGEAFWTTVKPFANPDYPMHHYDVGWSCRFAWHLDRELLRAVACSRVAGC